MPFYCDPNRVLSIIYTNYIVPSVASIAALSMIPIIFIYFRAYQKGEIETVRSFFYAGAVLFITILFTFITLALTTSQICHNIEYTRIFHHCATQAFIVQNLIVIGLFFYRLVYIFRGTSLALSKPIIMLFVIIYTLFCAFSIITGILWVLDVLSLLVTIIPGGIVLLTIYLVLVFIYKLYKTFQGNNDQYLLTLMRKTACLVSISTSFILFTTIVATVRLNFESIHVELIRFMIIMLDAYSSFLCILFSFQYFNRYYMKICGCVESKCFTICCKKYVMPQDVKNKKENNKCSSVVNKNKDNTGSMIVIC